MPGKDSKALIEAGLETREVIVDILSDGAIWADIPVVVSAGSNPSLDGGVLIVEA